MIWVTAAWAQDVISGGDLPELNAQNFRPSVDAPRALWVDEAARAPEGPVGRLLFHYTDDPLVYRTEESTVGLVRNVVQADLIGGWAFGPARLGLVVPLYLYANGDTASGTGLGDLALDGRFTIIDGDATPVDVALQGRISAPTSTVALPLGNPGVGWEITAVASRQLGPVLLAANLGTTGGPATDLENVSVDDAFTARAAVGVDVVEDVAGVTAEVASHLSYASLANSASSPTEALLSGWGRPSGEVVVRGGVGMGLTPGIGSPDFRVIVGVGYAPSTSSPTPTPKVADTDMDGLLDPDDACPMDPEDVDQWQDEDGCPDPDNDGDGLLDVADGCRNEPEDVDGWKDEDGCPDPFTLLTVAIVDEEQQPIELAKAVISAPDGRTWPVANGRASVEVPAGTYAVSARAGTYDPAQTTVEVPDGPPVGTYVVLKKQKGAKVVVTRDRIDLQDKVYFETASANIKKESYGLLDQAVQILVDYPEIGLLRVEGHTDSRG
ncbi:MAG: hypothetical protein KC621_02210, partial [Myxococcales bacterium]|nr:hypothetical protein [Myxococcales bacterium]